MKKFLVYLLCGIMFYMPLTAQRIYRVDPMTGEFQAIATADTAKIYASKFPGYFWFYVDTIGLKAMDSTKLATASAGTFMWALNNGVLRVSKLDSMLGRTLFYNKTGLVANRPMKVWCDTVTVSNGNAFSIDISTAGFTKVLGVMLTGSNNVNDANQTLQANVKSRTTSAVVINYTTPLTLVSVLTFNLSPGNGFVTNKIVEVTVFGY